MIRVGRHSYERRLAAPGFETVNIMMKSHGPQYVALSPFELKDEDGRLMENLWQFSKVYARVKRTTCRYSRFDARVIWDHPAEVHVGDDGKLTPEYVAWRAKGFANPDAVRYPVGFHGRHACLGALLDEHAVAHTDPSGHLLGYVEARKEIYQPLYMRLARRRPEYRELLEKLRRGENLLIVEIDGLHQESLPYYVDTYGVDAEFIQDGSMPATIAHLDLMLHDTKHPYGHGYCLARALLEDLGVGEAATPAGPC